MQLINADIRKGTKVWFFISQLIPAVGLQLFTFNINQPCSFSIGRKPNRNKFKMKNKTIKGNKQPKWRWLQPIIKKNLSINRNLINEKFCLEDYLFIFSSLFLAWDEGQSPQLTHDMHCVWNMWHHIQMSDVLVNCVRCDSLHYQELSHTIWDKLLAGWTCTVQLVLVNTSLYRRKLELLDRTIDVHQFSSITYLSGSNLEPTW